jgi:hypothetical protein
VGRVRSAPARSRVPRRLRLLLDPGALRYWAVVIVLAASLALLVARSVGRAEAAVDGWGTARTVLVVNEPVAAGDRLAASVREARWPAALVPATARTEVAPGDRAAAALDVGAVLTDAAVRPPDADPERRSVAIEVAEVPAPVAVGDRVDLWAPTPDGAGTGGDARRIAAAAEVLDRSDRALVVAVARDEVAAVAAATADGRIVVAGPA